MRFLAKYPGNLWSCWKTIDLKPCSTEIAVTKVKVQERGKKAVFLNESRETFTLVQVDGCVIVDAMASDWVLSKKKTADLIIELKGTDVVHGARQILSTAQFWTNKALRQGRIAGLLVCAQYPRISTTVQRIQDTFARSYGGPLHVIARNGEYLYERVFEYSGPF